MKRALLAAIASIVLSVLTGAVPAVVGSAADAAAAKPWTITRSAVGPLHLGETQAQLRKAGFAYYPCGPATGGHPCYFKGKLGDAVQFDVDKKGKVKQLMVNAASGAGHTFAFKSGVKVGSTVATIKAKERATYIGSYGYGPAYQLHKPGTHRWVTFFASGTKAKDKVYSISLSTYAKPAQGR